jgi:hypothetical protein
MPKIGKADLSTDIVPDQDQLAETEFADQSMHDRRQMCLVGGAGRTARSADLGQIDHEHVEFAKEPRHYLSERIGRLRPAVKKQEGR